MGSFLLCKHFVTDGHCPEAEFMITTEHRNHRSSKCSLANCNLWSTCTVQCVGDVPQQYWAKKNWILLLLFVCRWLLLTDARLFLQIDIFNYTLSHLFHRAEFLMSSKVKMREQGRKKLTHLWRGKRKSLPPLASLASCLVVCWCSVLFSLHTLLPLNGSLSAFFLVRPPGFNML